MSDESCECKNGNCDCGCEEACECECGHCCDDAQFHRHFLTKAEQIAELEVYLADLKLEIQAVEERLADLHK